MSPVYLATISAVIQIHIITHYAMLLPLGSIETRYHARRLYLHYIQHVYGMFPYHQNIFLYHIYQIQTVYPYNLKFDKLYDKFMILLYIRNKTLNGSGGNNLFLIFGRERIDDDNIH